MPYDVIVVPGFRGSEPEHWQSWLQEELPGARRVSRVDWHNPTLYHWTTQVVRAIDESENPVILVAHSFGSLVSTLAIRNRRQRVAGAFLVAPADPERFGLFGVRSANRELEASIARYLPDSALGVPGTVIASENDPWMKLPHAYAWARRWGLNFHNAGKVGHINVDSGHGPWPLIKELVEQFIGSLGHQIPEEQGNLYSRLAFSGTEGFARLHDYRLLYA
ncbi:RBBP9/YdeN family alpha/beta hydrolase [Marinimicrobium sp. ARAG 43.8]|uniref:RBBP9/YdeN family alpha/beta hydrolase n=1 Tax=Marinimicrobium sp. ARAG 43.8 TaxID=3418719 RepID=UPI003CF4A5A3